MTSTNKVAGPRIARIETQEESQWTSAEIVALRKPGAEMRDASPALEPVPSTSMEGARQSLTADGLSRAYGSIRAVDTVSLSICHGEVVALVGHSGSGKSTLLRLIAGLERPNAGRIAIDGREMSGPAAFVPPEARGVGMMFQDYALFPHLTVMKNVLFGLRNLPRSEAQATARRSLERVGLAGRTNDYPHALSGGEQQRVALARALAPNPRLLLMDEPFSNLDRRTREIVRDETTAVLREAGTTSLIVTHDPDDAMRIADRIIMMQAGRIVQAGTTEELYRRPASLHVARFFAELNEIPGVCRNGIVATPFGDVAAPPALEGNVVVCLRPKAIRLFEPAAGRRSGRVLSARCVGDTVLVELAVDGTDRPLRVTVQAEAAPPAGQRMGYELDTDGVMVFPADKA